MARATLVWLAVFLIGGVALAAWTATQKAAEPKNLAMRNSPPILDEKAPADYEVKLSDAEWREKLDAEQYQVLRKGGTERAFTGKYWKHKGEGEYACAGCGTVLFTSTTKFDSGCGWPSFFESLSDTIEYRWDNSYGMSRIEVRCKKCGGHLGHVFDDGPNPTGKRYCINSASIAFKELAKLPVEPKADEPKNE